MTENSRGRFIRFLVSGAFNTLISYSLYIALLQMFSYRISYVLAFLFGVVMAYAINRHFVFRASGGRRGPMLVFLIYLCQFVAGLWLTFAWVQWFHGAEGLAPLFSIVVSIPLTYLLNRLVFRHPPSVMRSSSK